MLDDRTGRQSQGVGIGIDGIDDGHAETARLATEVIAMVFAVIRGPALCFMVAGDVGCTVAYIHQVFVAVGGNVYNVALAEAEATGYACRNVYAP